MFKHTELQKRVEAMPHFQRHIATPDGMASAYVSLSVMTSPEGLICCAVSIDYVTEDKRTVANWPMALFGYNQQGHALADARALAAHYGIDMRLATDRVGWSTDSPVVKPTIITPSLPDFTV